MIVNVKSSETFEHPKRRTRCFCRFIKKLFNDWSLGLASMLAYNILISLLPVAIMIFAIIGFILENNNEAQEKLKNVIVESFPENNITRAGIRQVCFDMTKVFSLRFLRV